TELSMMGWNAPLTYCHGQVTTLTLSMLLSTVWLSDDHIDMMMEELAAQIAADPKLAAECVVAPLGFSSVIKAANFKKRYTKRDTPLLCCYADHVKENNLWWLYFPIHINDNHWVVGFINFKDVTFGYGNPQVTRLQNTSSHQHSSFFGKDFINKGDCMLHGVQVDSYSCGINTTNTIDCAATGACVWKPKHSIWERVRWFVQLAQGGKRE
ncbi:hypothetical protein L208DRAFT_1066500, partial [Tricholoma matsutake]